MRKLLPLAAAALLLALVAVWVPIQASLQAQSKAPGRKLAFLVGVRQYDHAQLQNLEYPDRDVEQFSDALKTAGFTVVLDRGAVALILIVAGAVLIIIYFLRRNPK